MFHPFTQLLLSIFGQFTHGETDDKSVYSFAHVSYCSSGVEETAMVLKLTLLALVHGCLQAECSQIETNRQGKRYTCREVGTSLGGRDQEAFRNRASFELKMLFVRRLLGRCRGREQSRVSRGRVILAGRVLKKKKEIVVIITAFLPKQASGILPLPDLFFEDANKLQ